MKVFSTILVISLALFGYVNAARDREEKVGGTAFKVLGRSGKMMIGKPGRNAIVINFEEMKEKDANNVTVGARGKKKHSFNSFAGQDFTFSSVVDFDYNGLKTRAFNFSADIAGTNATLNVQVHLFRRGGEFVNGNESTTVKNGTVKFNIELENWEFCNNSSNCASGEFGKYIDFVISLTSKSKPKQKERGKPPAGHPNKRRPKQYNLGDASFDLSEQIENDGVMKRMPEGYPKYELKGGKQLFTFRFLKFKRRATYDPSLTMEDDGGSEPNGATPAVRTSYVVFVAGFLAAILALLEQ